MNEQKEEVHAFIGKEIIADFYGCDAEKLNDEKYLRELLEKAAVECGMNVVQTFSVPFKPQGVDVVTIVSESALHIYTYPEYGNCFVNIFTCGTKADPMKGLIYLLKELEPEEMKIRIVKRGSW